MSRTVIAAVVAVVIAALTAIAYFITTKQADQLVRTDAASDLKRSYQVVQRLKALEMVEVMNKVERLSARPEFVAAIKSGSTAERVQQARIGFQKFTSDDKQGTTKPDIIALVDATGDILAMHDVPTVVPKQWKTAKGDSILPALNVVLGRRIIIADFWNYASKGMMKVGVAPIIDPDAPVNAKDPDGVVIIGAIVVAYAQTARSTQEDRKLLGTEIAYYDGKQVIASSFTHGPSSVEENTQKRDAVSSLLSSGKLSESGIQQISIEDVAYTATTVKLRRQHTKDLPSDYPPVTAGAVVLAPLEKASDDDSVGSVKWLILLLGGGALAIAMLGLYLSHRRLVAQVDQVEGGVTDIINGNVDRTFRPVGPELDGLANGLNVMLARLLGRPEPGEEEFDEEGNPIVPGRVEFDESEERPAPDPDLAALAQESEPDYYKRVYTDYLAARKASGAPDEVSFENFIAKLKVNEGKLKAQYQCRAVRFRVVTKDGKVTLKPVPIFA